MKLFENRAKLLFKTGKLPDLKKYIGHKVTIPGNPPITTIIEKIVGNIWKPQFYEINDGLLIGMLRFHAQMVHDTSITEDQFRAFEEMDMHAKKLSESEADDDMEGQARRIAGKIMKNVASEQKH